MEKGQSIIEVIVAVAIFIIIAGSSAIVIVGSLSASRLAEEETSATAIAKEGLEAVESIRNQEWDLLLDGQHGLDKSSGIWQFSSTQDVDPSGKYTRVVEIQPVNRDTNGNIVESGDIDYESKIISSTVNWDFTSSRKNTVQMSTLLTNWQESKSEIMVTPTPTPPTFNNCIDVCTYNGFTSGTCRANSNQCVNNGEVHSPDGDAYCTGGGNSDTCCCIP